MTSERIRLLRRSVGYVSFGVVIYLAALTFCFPYDRAREMAVALGAKSGYDLEIAGAGPSFPFGIELDNIVVRSRAVVAGARPAQARFDSARLALLPLLISKGQALDLHLVGLGGSIDVSASGLPSGGSSSTSSSSSLKKGPFHYDLQVRNLNMAQLPGAREMLNLPLGGSLEIAARLDSKSGNFADAQGEISFKCAACVVGDGKTPIKIGGGNAFLAAGLTLPRVRLGDLTGKTTVQKGVAKLQGVQARSPDAELTLEGEITLRDPVAYSGLNAYLRFKLGDALLKASPTIGSILQMAAAPGLRNDLFYGLHLTGTLSAPISAFSASTPPGLGGVAVGRPPGRPGIMPVLAQLPVPPPARSTVALALPPPPPAPVTPPPPSPAPAPPPPPPPPPPIQPPPAPIVAPPSPPPPAPPSNPSPSPEASAAAPPVRGTGAGGGFVGSVRGMLRGGAGNIGAAAAPTSAGGSAPPGPPVDGSPGPPTDMPPVQVPPPAEQVGGADDQTVR